MSNTGKCFMRCQKAASSIVPDEFVPLSRIEHLRLESVTRRLPDPAKVMWKDLLLTDTVAHFKSKISKIQNI